MEKMGWEEQRAAQRAIWAAHVEQQRRSGKSIKGFCQDVGLKVWQFHYWSGVLRPKAEVSGFVEVRMKGGGVTIETAGCRVHVERGFDAELLRQVVTALRAA
jgi:hypothetical protein